MPLYIVTKKFTATDINIYVIILCVLKFLSLKGPLLKRTTLRWPLHAHCLLLGSVLSADTQGKKCGNSKAVPIETLTDPEGSRKLRLSEFIDNRHMIAEMLSVLRKGCLYPPKYIPGTHFSIRDWVDSRVKLRPEGLSEWKISMTPSEKGTRVLPACSAVPQPTAPLRTAGMNSVTSVNEEILGLYK